MMPMFGILAFCVLMCGVGYFIFWNVREDRQEAITRDHLWPE